jgi:hypothetical protein
LTIASPLLIGLVTPPSLTAMRALSSSWTSVAIAFEPLGRPFGLPDSPGLNRVP